ncbi:MAG: polyketide synthase [Mycobacterium sp.]
MSDSPIHDHDPVVITGMALEAPGGRDTPDKYWEALSGGQELLSPFPEDRGWPIAELISESRRDGNQPIHNRGGFLTGAAEFDPEFFGISPHEAVAIDPQQRVALRVSWRALENTGINPDSLAGHDVGCYIGASVTGNGPDLAKFSDRTGHLMTGTAMGVISGRIAHILDLAGPAITVDAACASALVAFHLAVQALRAGDCDLALAGGVCVMGSPGYFVEFSKHHALSDDGRCRPYSAQASGTIWAEGAAMFVLQRRSTALRAGHRIYAEVLASCLNQDGRSASLLAPNGQAQTQLLGRALRVAGVSPDKVGMVEGHGTGTRLGDRAELQSLARTYGSAPSGTGAALGSVKSNLGHAQAAAGALGLAKVLVAAEHAAVPPTLHCVDASGEIDWEKQGLRLARALTPWPAIDGRRVAAVSASGVSGTNAHLVIACPEMVA